VCTVSSVKTGSVSRVKRFILAQSLCVAFTSFSLMSVRSLWARVASHLQPQEVEVIRSLIGNQLIDENDSLWLEVDALEDVLQIVQSQNEELLQARSTSSHTRLTDGPQRQLLEQNISLLLRRLDLTAAADSDSMTDSGAAQCNAALSPLLTCPRDEVIYNYLRKGEAKRASSAGNLMLSARSGSRPESRGTPRSARSAPDFLESAGSKLNVQHIDTVLTELQQAFAEEAEVIVKYNIKVIMITALNACRLSYCTHTGSYATQLNHCAFDHAAIYVRC
jgi:Coiled-coil domain-containing protein 24 family